MSQENPPLTIEERLARVDLHRYTLTAAGRSWLIDAVKDQDRLLAAADHFDNFPYGLLLWDGAVVLADALAEIGSLEGRSVLELGAGVGLTGLAARHLKASVVQMDHAMPPRHSNLSGATRCSMASAASRKPSPTGRTGRCPGDSI